MASTVKIGERLIGLDQPCFIIAEAGVNHNGSLDLAHQLVDKAKESGADAVKFQSFITEELIIPDAPKAAYQVETTGRTGSQFPMLKSLELTFEQQAELKAHCDSAGILYLCTPYEQFSVDILDRIGVSAYKVASTDTTNIPFLRHIASKGRPVLLSTGMCSLGEVEQAVAVFQEAGMLDRLILLHCTSEYPVRMEEVNLRAILTMRQAFGCPVGFSDHTQGIGASPWAAVLGAAVIEKHFTLDRAMVGPDHRASLEPAELTALVHQIRAVEIALGDGVKRLMPSEVSNKSRMQKSLVARRDLTIGATITKDDIACKRPGSGLPPSFFDNLIGRKTTKGIAKDEFFTLASIDWEG